VREADSEQIGVRALATASFGMNDEVFDLQETVQAKITVSDLLRVEAAWNRALATTTRTLAAMLARGESPPGVAPSGLNRRPARRRLALPEKRREETSHGRRVVF
jgi:hypothetical protein